MSSIAPAQFIGANLHVRVVDSRILEGILTVIDPFGNLLLSNVYETSVDRLNNKNLHVREIGLVSVPRETIVSIKVDRKTHKNIFGTEQNNI
ncbi:uncharacterized protein SPAPADRAFT_138491 [Spathaspora passalidarum NRRL Y-27907]|uniref:Sm domain-containing protein n=1 Tax=Spathaspora passalidarum (strain NRRL Y-27907 / 11-Y1) TaxID=619300 RepID=G3APB4_SPAPN|nr:uncharacterized protein SPAPADRAFT_138491 [Spathaspora passalidarum NRRL Y-27907]EGW32092.1 hypothetical protein SPAPADRAFT_138491 [Spathaspora passalidarum NRRL Y-27907]